MTTENNSAVTPAAANSTATVTSPIVTTGEQPVVDSPIVENVPVVDNPEPAPAPSPEPAPAGETDAAKAEGVQKRINEITAQKYAESRRADTERNARLAAEAKSAELLAQIAKGANPGTETQAKPALTQEEMDKLVNERALEMARANEFNKACDAIVDEGQKEFGKEWDDAIKNLNLVGAIGQGVSPEFLETAVELKNPHKVLHYLGANLDEAEKLTKMAPKRMAMEMARLEAQLNTPAPVPTLAPVSNAPAPVIPVGGAAKPGVPSIDDPNLTTEQFMQLRAQQADARRGRYQRTN